MFFSRKKMFNPWDFRGASYFVRGMLLVGCGAESSKTLEFNLDFSTQKSKTDVSN
jgi:hypothetical protein